jgi:hypothetical protein
MQAEALRTIPVFSNSAKPGKKDMVRINAAPRHSGPTFPRHIHLGKEENIVTDNVTFLETPVQLQAGHNR